MLSGECRGRDSRILEAAIDYKYLLDRGYPAKSSLDLIVSRYSMNRVERSLILRCVHRSTYSLRVSSIIANDQMIRGRDLIVDLLNVSTTLIAYLEGECLYLCDDGFVRDVGGSRYWRGRRSRVVEAIEMIRGYISSIKPRSVYIVIDRKAPMSSDILNQAMRILRNEVGVEVMGTLADRADKEIIELHRKRLSGSSVISTSDSLVLENAHIAYDLAGRIIMTRDPSRIDSSIYKLITQGYKGRGIDD